MGEPRNRHVPLSLSRRLACDVMHFSQKGPLVVAERRLHLAGLVAARQAARPRPSWFAVFMKAYAVVSARRAHVGRPSLALTFPRLYALARGSSRGAGRAGRWGGVSDTTLPLPAPRETSTTRPAPSPRRHKTDPVEALSYFRTQLLISRLPRPLRRLLWWLGLNLIGRT